MSITIGFLNKDNKPAHTKMLEVMGRAYKNVPFDSYSYEIVGNFALAHMNIDILTENPIEKQPVESESNRYLASGRIRIDNRKELIQLLNIKDNLDVNKLSDIKLFLYVFEKWNYETFDKIIGDFATVIWDKQERKIIVSKDTGGVYPMYYYETDKTFYFASTISAFFELPEFVREVNYQKTISYILPFPDHGNPEETFYQGINYFRKFHYYIINNDGIITRKRHWYPERLEPIIYPNINDYIEHFKELYDDAVIKRVSRKGVTGSFLSGGLDSSSSTVIALQHLRKLNQKIYSYSSVPLYPEKCPSSKSISDETQYVQAILDMYPHDIIHQFVKSPDFHPIDVMDIELKYNKIYTSNFQNGYWYWKILQLASHDNVNVILTGQAGNLTISRTGTSLYEGLFRTRRFSELFNQIKKDAELNESNTFRLLVSNFLKIFKRHIFNLFPTTFDGTFNRDHLTPILEEVLDQFKIKERYLEQVKAEMKIKFTHGIINTFENARILQMNLSNKFVHQNIDYHLQNRIETRDPTRDKRISEFTKQVPVSVFKHNGIERYLIREAMKERLPKKVLSNYLKGTQANDLSYRVKMDISRVEEILNSGFDDEFIKFDFEKINKTLKNIKDENITQDLHAKTTKIVLQTCAIIKFLNMNK